VNRAGISFSGGGLPMLCTFGGLFDCETFNAASIDLSMEMKRLRTYQVAAFQPDMFLGYEGTPFRCAASTWSE